MGYFKRFKEWQNYIHYLLLALIISLVADYFGAPITGKMFLIILITLFIGDSVVHAVFWYLPRKIRWRD